MRSIKSVVIFYGLMCVAGHASASTIGWYKVPDDAVTGSAEDGRVLEISRTKFDEITSKARVGDRIDVDGDVYEAVVVVPRYVLTVVNKSTRTEMRVLVKASSKKK